MDEAFELDILLSNEPNNGARHRRRGRVPESLSRLRRISRRSRWIAWLRPMRPSLRAVQSCEVELPARGNK